MKLSDRLILSDARPTLFSDGYKYSMENCKYSPGTVGMMMQVTHSKCKVDISQESLT